MLRLLDRWAVDGRFVLAVFLLSLFGIAMVYSAGQVNTPDPVVTEAWKKQAVWFLLALGSFTLVARIPLRWWEWIAIPAYTLGLVLLAATLVIGTGSGTAEGTKSWIGFGGFRFQPSELAKIASVLALARLLASRQEPPTGLRDLFAPGILVGVPLGLTLLQGDLGSALAFIGLLFAMLYWAGTPPFLLGLCASPVAGLILAFDTRIWSGYIVVLFLVVYLFRYRLFLYESAVVVIVNVAAGAIASPLWHSLKAYQQNRLLVFLDPTVDPRGAGYNLMQSKVAIGSGGLTGKGYLLGTQKRFDFLPEQHTDFIFSVVGEELGFLGAGLALIAFGYVLYRLVRMAEEANDPFAGLVLFGIFGVWIVHVFINIGMTVGIVPITGIPLPFVSYGGTFLLTCWLAVGMAARLAHEE